MALKKMSEEQIEKMSMIELANVVLADEKKDMNFIDLFHKVGDLKGFTDVQRDELLARFYTDLNVDGRFTTLGSNMWGLKRWYPVDQTSEKSLAESRKRELEEDEFLDEELDEELDDELDDDESSELFEDYIGVEYEDED